MRGLCSNPGGRCSVARLVAELVKGTDRVQIVRQEHGYQAILTTYTVTLATLDALADYTLELVVNGWEYVGPC